MGIFDDLIIDDLNGYEVAKAKTLDVKAQAHVVNGGESTELHMCFGCKGTGRWMGRGRCAACKGVGKVAKRKAAAQKGAETARNNLIAKKVAFAEQHADLYKFLHEAKGWSDFGRSMWDAVEQYGSLTEKQESAAYSMMAKVAANKAAKEANKAIAAEARIANAPTVALAAIEALFATATDNAIKRPIFRAGNLAIRKAPATGRNAGALYVKRDDDTYLGKLVNGKFFATNAATPEDTAQLHAVAADPTDAAIKYSRRTGSCGCCGKGLVNPVSILAGIGPICASKWGLDFMRELAATEYADMKAADLKKIKE